MKDNNISRRDFLKITGTGAAALGAAACTGGKSVGTTEAEGPEVMPQHIINDDKVSLLGYGCMRWQMIKDENGKDIIDQNSVNELVDYAIAHGINYFDSAPVYLQGQSEAATAKALSRYPRESYYVATKMSNFKAQPTLEESIAMYKRSLDLFSTDHIDYYLCHSLSGGDAFKSRFEDNGLIDFLLKEREAGHIRHLGFSFHGTPEGFDEMMERHEKYHWDFVQIQMNYIDWKHASGGDANAEYLYNELDKREIPIVVMEPLLGGQLSNVPGPVAEQLKEREPNSSVASWAFRFVASHPRILTILSGMTYMEHLQDNLKTLLHFKPLVDQEYEILESMATLIRDYPLINCTDCKYCMPCPYGIDIPSIFKHYNNSLNAGYVAETAEQADFQKLKRKYLTSYNKAVEGLRQADHCTGCNQCTPHCPQHIRIPQEIQRIDRYVEDLKQNTL